MQRHFMRLSYLGAGYHGWQRQPNASSVQQTLEEALSTVLRCPTTVTGAGRTDTGVNASMMIAHLDLPDDIDTDKLLRNLNSIVGPGIAVQSIFPVAADAHARFDATARTYHYYACRKRNPFLGKLAWTMPADINIDAMNRAAQILLTTSDFTSFSKLHTDVKTNICNVMSAQWRPVATSDYAMAADFVFEICADRFLRNMVRAIVGTLVEVGRGKISLSDFQKIIDSHDRCAAGTSMPGEPLFLHRIDYPFPIK